jgi:MoxR-like ATPase
MDGVLTSMARHGRGVVLWDEINAGTERDMTRFHDLWDERRELVLRETTGEVVRVPPGSDFLMMAAYNRGYRGLRELSQALPNRFAFKLHFDYDRRIEAQLIGSKAVREVGEKLRAMKREISTPVSTNMMQEFVEIGMAFDAAFAIENWLQAFAPHEQQAVANVMDLYQTQIQAELEELERTYEDLEENPPAMALDEQLDS